LAPANFGETRWIIDLYANESGGLSETDVVVANISF
jgi:hypothetical protein